jgi:hypothetical protein
MAFPAPDSLRQLFDLAVSHRPETLQETMTLAWPSVQD